MSETAEIKPTGKDEAVRKRLHQMVDEIGDFGWREFTDCATMEVRLTDRETGKQILLTVIVDFDPEIKE